MDMPREAEVLEGFAKEEAAKILILMDAVRCPVKLLPSKLGTIIGWFYNHLARLIYADAVTWKPMHLAQLRQYVEPRRKAIISKEERANIYYQIGPCTNARAGSTPISRPTRTTSSDGTRRPDK